MTNIEKNDVFYICSLIEYIGRRTMNSRADIVKALGEEEIKRQLNLAEVNHCLSFEQVADEIIEFFNIKQGNFDSVKRCKYTVPSIQSIGKVYQRLIYDTINSTESVSKKVMDVFKSFISDEISNFNSSVYYSNPDYIKHSYLKGELLE